MRQETYFYQDMAIWFPNLRITSFQIRDIAEVWDSTDLKKFLYYDH